MLEGVNCKSGTKRILMCEASDAARHYRRTSTFLRNPSRTVDRYVEPIFRLDPLFGLRGLGVTFFWIWKRRSRTLTPGSRSYNRLATDQVVDPPVSRRFFSALIIHT